MDRKLVYEYIQLCKNNDYDIIKAISLDINLFVFPELVAQKYKIILNQVLGIIEIIKHEHNLGHDGLKHVFDQYNLLVGGKGGKGKSKGKNKKKKKKNDSDDHDQSKQDNDDDDEDEALIATGTVAGITIAASTPSKKQQPNNNNMQQVNNRQQTNNNNRQQSNNVQHHNKPNSHQQKNKDPAVQKILSGLATLLQRSEQSIEYPDLSEIKDLVSDQVNKVISDRFKKAAGQQSGGNQNISHESSDMSPVILSDS